ncbi:MAG TPA: SCO family protein [Chitinophagaceae bacterium]|nr:SCO family protein [Chitinophagaceae bacterium]
MLALLLPLVCYFIVKKSSEKAVQMPPHYLPDSINEKIVNGKKRSDTVWHRVPDFKLVNQLGDSISWKDMAGQIVVADFFFTHCPTICPGLTRNMKRLQESITNSERVGDRTNKQVHFLSFSIDPERDSVSRLKGWADRYQINPDQWWLLSGNKKTIYDLIINDMKVIAEDGKGVDTNFIHTDHFVLIDSNRYVRGYYHGLDSVSLAKLSKDLVLLTLEKGPNEKSFLAGKLQLIVVVFLVAIAAVTFLLYYFRKKS